MATKAPYIVILGVCLLSIVFASVLHGKNTKNRNIVNGALVAAILAIVVAIAIGWFYYRNYQASGSWFKSSPDSFSGGRPYQSFKDVVTGSRLWALFYSHSSNTPLFSTALTSFAAAGILMSTTKKKLREVADNKPLRIIYALMVIATLGVFATQIRLAVGYGSINFRYMLPVLLPFSLVLAYGLLAFKNIRAQLVATASVFMGAITILQTASSTAVLRQVPEVSKFDNGIGKVFVAASSNGIPVIGTASLIVLFLLGSILLIISLYKLSVSSRN